MNTLTPPVSIHPTPLPPYPYTIPPNLPTSPTPTFNLLKPIRHNP